MDSRIGGFAAALFFGDFKCQLDCTLPLFEYYERYDIIGGEPLYDCVFHCVFLTFNYHR